MKVSNETKVGILAAISITILVLGYNFMRGKNLWTKTKTYYAAYEEVDGLFASNPVVVNGFNIGQVESVKMDPKSLKLIVGVRIPDDIDVPINSTLRIVNNDMVGSKAIELIRGSASAFASDGDTLASDRDANIVEAVSEVLTPLSKSLKQVLAHIDSAISGVDLQSTMKDLSDALGAFSKTTRLLKSKIEEESDKLSSIIGNVSDITDDIKQSTPVIRNMISQLDSASGMFARMELDSLIAGFDLALKDISKTMGAIQEGQGTLGKLATDDAVFDNLNNMLVSLDSLAKDIQRYPDRYIVIREKNRQKATERKKKDEEAELQEEVK